MYEMKNRLRRGAIPLNQVNQQVDTQIQSRVLTAGCEQVPAYLHPGHDCAQQQALLAFHSIVERGSTIQTSGEFGPHPPCVTADPGTQKRRCQINRSCLFFFFPHRHAIHTSVIMHPVSRVCNRQFLKKSL
jgi:hypothetical protein